MIPITSSSFTMQGMPIISLMFGLVFPLSPDINSFRYVPDSVSTVILAIVPSIVDCLFQEHGARGYGNPEGHPRFGCPSGARRPRRVRSPP